MFFRSTRASTAPRLASLFSAYCQRAPDNGVFGSLSGSPTQTAADRNARFRREAAFFEYFVGLERPKVPLVAFRILGLEPSLIRTDIGKFSETRLPGSTAGRFAQSRSCPAWRPSRLR